MAIDIRRAAKKLLPGLLEAKDAKLNEADTVQRIMLWLKDVLGWDPQRELSRELHRSGKFLDIALKIDNQIVIIVEVKQAGKELSERHLEQAQGYAIDHKVWWLLLTNGTHWTLYRVVPSKSGLEKVVIFDIDLSEAENLESSLMAMASIHRKAISPDALEQLYERTQASAPKVIARALFTEDVLKLLAREIRREQKVLFDAKELKEIVESMFSEETLGAIGHTHIIKKRSRRTTVKEGNTAIELEPTLMLPKLDSTTSSSAQGAVDIEGSTATTPLASEQMVSGKVIDPPSST